MEKGRRKFTSQEKVMVLRRHLLDKVPISDLCEEHGVKPTVFYRWQKQFFENGARAFDRDRGGCAKLLEKRIIEFNEKLARKNEILSELLDENLFLKQRVGSPGVRGGKNLAGMLRDFGRI